MTLRNIYSRTADNQELTRATTATTEQTIAAKRSYEQLLSARGYVLDKCAELGAGRYSKVRLATKLDNKVRVAIKVIDKRKVSEQYRCKFLPREVKVWAKLRHPNLCRMVDYFEIGPKVFLTMELAERGDLLLHVQRSGPLSEECARVWLLQLLAAVQYIHELGIAHRDLKLENILIAADRSLKIADFGFSCEMKNDDLSATFCGSKSYSAPEILMGKRYSPFKADVWSLGVIAFVLVTNRMPFNERVPSNSTIVQAQRVRAYRYSRRLHISEACQKTIDSMLTFEWRLRPSVVDVTRSEWFVPSDHPNLPTAAGDSVISPS